ncbi:MAG: radical SAM protein [Candidatus Lindowbacteria bacterium]|nr:radical SAM protein [Candidatus Lindowbacteria bacterium]
MKKSVHDVERYRKAKLSNEHGTIIKKTAPLRVCLVFPNTYHTGMSNLAVHEIYSILNARKDCACERSFCEEPIVGRSIETGSQLAAFDILAFSVSFELDYPNVLRVLRKARIPMRTADRDESHPLVIAGGPCVFSNPEPLADCFDLCAIGEGEELIGEIIDVVLEAHEERLKRAILLHRLSRIPGAYVPSHHAPVYSDDGALVRMESRNANLLPVAPRVVDNLDDYPCSSAIITTETEFANMFLIELGRGCRRGCKYCLACYTYFRRNRSLDSLKTQILAAQGLSNRIGLVTSDLADYPHREELLAFLLGKGLGFSVSSVRADSITDDLLEGMKAASQRTLTLAPEVASDRLASLTGKNITEEMLLKAVDMALRHRIVNFRLYFMIGLPGEEDTDVEAIAALVSKVQRKMRQEAKALGKVGSLTISVNPFVPKPFTPWQAAPFEDSAVLLKRVALLRRSVARIPNARLNVESPRMAALQCAFARGDRRVASLAQRIAEGSTVAEAMRGFGDQMDKYLAAQKESVGMLPWNTVRPPARRRISSGND